MPAVDGVAAGFTAEVLNTVVATGGSPVTLHEGAFNPRGPYNFFWPMYPDADLRPRLSQADNRAVIRFAAPASAITLAGTLYVLEQG